MTTTRLALAAFVAAISALTAAGTSARADDAADLARRCEQYYQDGQYSQAIFYCDTAARLEPDNANYWNIACFTRAIAGRGLDVAIDQCDRSLRLRPNNAETLDSRGLAYLRAGKLDKAIDDYDAVLIRKPRLAASLYGRGLAKLKKGDSSGNADIADAKSIERDIAKTFEGYGIDQIQSPPSAAAATNSDPCALAGMHWQSTESIHTVAAYQDHLARFPTCTFAGLARARIAALSKPEPAAPAARKATAGKPQHARSRAASAPDERPSGQLDCSRPGQWAACANRALSTVPGSN